ncbi:hypothetical protein GSI_02779 [Ganoderma sinense ZZ0214-1]|uniref:DUF6534 domain-containing protein n=1 Tax=Ganoderma sinense ZZ0214-1 TaxID=1077348 RepID=A0A2G8SMK2_9APHY|nr:hypothetical protein GSI_02779 [Ganoderma sinense ZZ0214-1]
MDSVPPSTLPAAAVSRIKEALACAQVGTIVSTGVYGITVLQAYMYFQNSTHDSMQMRSFVGLLFVLDTVSLALGVAALFKYVVSDFGEPLLLLHIPPTLALEDALTVVIRTFTQCFFAYRIWALSKRNVTLVTSVVILALCSFGPGMAISVDMYTDDDIFSLGTLKTRILAGFANGLSAVCDILITASLCYYLHSKRTGFRRTDSMIDRLIVYAVNRGALTAICQAGEMITTVAFPGRFIFIPFALLNSKLYCNTLLATLNAQKSMKREGDNIVELGTQFINRLNAPTSENGTCRHTAGQLVGASDSIPTFVMDISVGKNTVRTPSLSERKLLANDPADSKDAEAIAPSISYHTLHIKE